MAGESTRWNPGSAPYATWLKTLTPDKYRAHMEERRAKKSMRKAMEEVIKNSQSTWVQAFNNAGVQLMKRAMEEGDVQAYTALYDRIIGKPIDVLDIEENRILPWSSDKKD
jgi:hypothetical protein